VSQSNVAMAETVADAQATVDQGESGRHDDPPATEPEPHGGRQPMSREELVAAARRAAHAASRQQPAAPERSGPVAERPSRAPVAQARRGGLLANQRPVLIVAVVALLAAGAGMLYGKLTKGSHQAPAARIEQSVAPGKQSAVETLEHEDVTIGGFSVTDPAADAAATVAPTPVAVPPSDTQAEPSAVAPIAGAGAQESALDLPPATIGPLSLRLAAAQGDSEAQIEIADRYAAGNGVERDLGKAAEWYQRAACAGNARAQYRLASLYERGRGVEKDLGRARVWYQRAAEQGNVKAMHNLGVLYTGQAGTEPDYATAAKWFAKAAEYGLADSQFNLAILYENGLGVARSTPEAYKWYALAAKRGDAEAAKRRDMVRGRLSPSAVATIDNALKSWRPLEPGPGNDQAAVGAVLTKPEASADPSSQVIAVQSMLNRLGYDAGPVDGILASRTTEAIRRFQKRSGLPETGEISDELLVALKDLAG
jgi:localization factor PodJL